MNDFKELDPAEQIPTDGRWYVGVKPRACEYLHEDLKLYAETVHPLSGTWSGLWNTEVDALFACEQYYMMHERRFPYAERFAELSIPAATNTTSCESQHMVFN